MSRTRFFVFETGHDADLFFIYINFRHSDICLSVEKDVDHEQPFLDVLIHNGGQHLKTAVFRKKSFIGLLIKFLSFTASCRKH